MSKVVYLGRIPHGFYENEIKSYFSQFGPVTRMRLARSKKTGGSKHYGFVEFQYEATALAASEAMHNYLLDGHLLQCVLLSPEEVHQNMFEKTSKMRRIPWTDIARRRHNKIRDAAHVEKRIKRLARKETARNKKLEGLGYEYKFTAYSEGGSKPAKARRSLAPSAPAAENAADAGSLEKVASMTKNTTEKDKASTGKLLKRTETIRPKVEVPPKAKPAAIAAKSQKIPVKQPKKTPKGK